jgi:hypothetical protein
LQGKSSVIQTRRQRLIGALKDDRGAAALVIAAIIAVLAFTALTVFLDKFTGGRTLARLQSSSSSQSYLVQAVMASFLNYSATAPTYSTSPALPCPDTAASPTGSASDCSSATGVTTGVLPWKDLGLSQDDAVDPYGDYYTYAVSHSARSLCKAITNGYDTSSEFTGTLITASDLTLNNTLTGDTRAIAFAIIGHGPNRKGAKSRNNPTGATATATGHENTNATTNTGNVYIDAYSTSFDDVVYAPSNADLEKICKSLTPQGTLNAQLAENFDSPTERTNGYPDSNKFARSGTNVTATADARTTSGAGNYVASMLATGDYLASNAYNYNFDGAVRPIYVSLLWTPDPLVKGMSDAGLSIGLRATAADLGAGTDDFTVSPNYGLTIRFFCGTGDTTQCGAGIVGSDISGTGVTNYISIRDNGVNKAYSSAPSYSSGQISLIRGKTYLVEAYDDGTTVWARITRNDDYSKTAYVRYDTSNYVHSGSQQVVLINHGAGVSTFPASYLDNVIIGYPMLALESSGTDSYAATSSAHSLGFTASSPRSVTVEAWVRPLQLPGSGNVGTIFSDWDTSDSTVANNGFRLYVDSTGLVYFDVAGNVSETKSTGITLKVGTWTHVAVAFDGTNKKVSFYENGALSSVTSTAITTGVNDTGTHRYLSAGAAYNGSGSGTNLFIGYIADVRVWQEARSSANVLANFETRQNLDGSTTNLLLNWQFDRESGGISASNTANTNVTNRGSTSGLTNTTGLHNAYYAASLAQYFRPFSDSANFCPSANRVGAYQCDLRATAAAGATGSTTATLSTPVTLPSNLYSIGAKIWGAGGGGYDQSSASTPYQSPGGPGGFTQGLLKSINGSPVYGAQIDLYAGGGGDGATGSSNSTEGAGGGAGSGIFKYATVPVPVLVAGGGGGGSYSADSNVGTCSADSGGITQCGIGGFGGGYNTTASHAYDGSFNKCGGKGGDDSPAASNPPTSGTYNSGGVCNTGGALPTITSPSTSKYSGGGGSSTVGLGGSVGASSFIMPGGTGYSASGGYDGGGGGGGGVLLASGVCSTSTSAVAGGGQAGGYDTSNGSKPHGYGGGGGAGCANATSGDIVNPNGALGSVTLTGASNVTCSGTINNVNIPGHQKTLTVTSTQFSGVTWAETCSMTDSNGLIPSPPTTIKKITNNGDNTYTITLNGGNMSPGIANFSASGTVTSSAVLSTTPAGYSTDYYYFPSYMPTTYSKPGVGGTTGASVNGTAGAVVLIW